MEAKNHEIRFSCSQEFKEGTDNFFKKTNTGLMKTRFYFELFLWAVNYHKDKYIKEGSLKLELK